MSDVRPQHLVGASMVSGHEDRNQKTFLGKPCFVNRHGNTAASVLPEPVGARSTSGNPDSANAV